MLNHREASAKADEQPERRPSRPREQCRPCVYVSRGAFEALVRTRMSTAACRRASRRHGTSRAAYSTGSCSRCSAARANTPHRAHARLGSSRPCACAGRDAFERTCVPVAACKLPPCSEPVQYGFHRMPDEHMSTLLDLRVRHHTTRACQCCRPTYAETTATVRVAEHTCGGLAEGNRVKGRIGHVRSVGAIAIAVQLHQPGGSCAGACCCQPFRAC